MGASKLQIIPSLLTTRYSDTEYRVVAIDELAWAALLAMSERLLWRATYPDAEISDGLDIGERAIDQLQNYVMLTDILTYLQCICDNTTAAAGSTAESAYNEKAAASGRLIMEGKKTWDKPSVTGSTPLYGELTWEAALARKCQISQYILDQMIFQLTDFSQTMGDLLALSENEIFQMFDEFLSRVLGIFVLPWAVAKNALLNILSLFSDWTFIDQLTTNYNDIVCTIYNADTPEDAATALMAGPADQLPFGSLWLEYVMRAVWEGQRRVSVFGTDAEKWAPYDVSAYNDAYCDGCGGVVGPQTQYVLFDDQAWDATGRSSNWTLVDRPDLANSFNYISEPATSPTQFPYSWHANSLDNDVTGNWGTITLTVPPGVSSLTARLWTTTICNDNWPTLDIIGAASGAGGGVAGPTVTKSVTAGETMTVRLYNIDFGSNACNPKISNIQLIYT